MSMQIGDQVPVLRDISRAEGPYAKQGEIGIIQDIFRPIPTGFGEIKRPSAKVLMSEGEVKIKTFRLTSLKKI